MIRLPVRISFRLETAFFLGGIVLAEYFSPWRTTGRAIGLLLAIFLMARYIGQSARHFRLALQVHSVLRARFLEIALTFAALVMLASQVFVWVRELVNPSTGSALDPIYRQYTAAFLLMAGLRMIAGDFPVRRILHRLDLRPAQTVALGFGSAILAGTLLLSLPLSVTRLEDLSLLNALFTATSAVTVTGLVVYDPGTFHTAFGQAVLLVLIQLGGVGTMAASASLLVLAGRRLRLSRAAALQESMDLETVGHVRSQVKTIIGITAMVEAAGAVVLYLLWQDRPGIERPAFAALFHAISAFCNAGFSIFATNLTPFVNDLKTNAVFAVLIVVGGLGFPVLRALRHVIVNAATRRRVPRLTLHARLVILTTGILLAVGAGAALALEWRGALAPLPGLERLAAAGFLSVTARTAGFNTIDTSALAPAMLWILMLLMFVGGSPGSTAGGIKTATAATVMATLWATIQGRPQVEAYRRTIADEQVAKALALVGISTAVIATGVLLLLATQKADPLALTFEVVSAFGTVGLSTGVTPALSAAGKFVIIVVMFVGRTGPLTLGFALAARARQSRVVYPAEKIMIG